MKPNVGETWFARGLWGGEGVSLVRIMEILPSGCVDVNYELDATKPADLRILPADCLLEEALVRANE
jgi:hypothetical protein